MKNNYLLLADILKAKRTIFGDSLRRVAGEVGISHTELARIENGNRENFSLLTLVKLCEVLNIDVIKLLMITGYVPFDEEYFTPDALNTIYDFINVLEPDDEELDEEFDEEFDNGGVDVVEENEQTSIKESVREPKKIVKQWVEHKSCKDFDPRDVPSYVQYDIIPLPSKGECYAHKKGNIPVAYLTAADENLITSRNMYENGSMIDIILERKILDKSIRVADLCKGDRDAIAIWLRATAYGPEYPITARYNGEDIDSVIDLSDIKFLDFNLVGDENGWFDYTVSSNGDKIKFKILSSSEENNLVKANKLAEEIINRGKVVSYMDESIKFIDTTDKKDKDEVIEALNLVKKWCLNVNVDAAEVISTTHSTYITDRMFAQTMSINGNTDREYIKNYIENMRAKDAIEYRKYLSDNIPGVDLNITIPIPESMGGGSFDTFLSIGETVFINV